MTAYYSFQLWEGSLLWSWSNLEGIFSKGSWTRRLLLYLGERRTNSPGLARWSIVLLGPIGLLFSCWLTTVVLYPAKGREAPWNPTCFQQGPLAPLRGIYRTTLGLMANLRGPFPPRWALTAGLLTTKSLDHSSTESTARPRSRFSATERVLLLFIRPRLAVCFEAILVVYPPLDSFYRWRFRVEEETHVKKSVKRDRISKFCGLSGLKWIDVCNFFFIVFCCELGSSKFLRLIGGNLSLYCKQIYEVVLVDLLFLVTF